MITREGRLRQFFAGYFHQDWDLGGGSWSQVVDSYIGGSAPSDARVLLEDLRAVKASGAGYVTKFDVDAEYLSQFPVQAAGGREHTEHWIPAERLDEFNEHIVGMIEVVAEFHR